MTSTSEYTFPIFISSPDYNLQDLRAELARYLKHHGYRPILSSAEGFPDNSPKLQPWESCLTVLAKCFVMVLIIDGRYGTELSWPNYPEIFEQKKYSPTHGEYLFAHRNNIRMFVFIRRSLMPHYASFKKLIESHDRVYAERMLKKTLPEYVNYNTLEFIHQVKTNQIIPWINEFENVTDIKSQIQKKLINHLAESFILKDAQNNFIQDSFNKFLNSLPIEEQKKVLIKLPATKNIIQSLNELEEAIRERDKSIELLKSSTKLKAESIGEYKAKIAEMNEKIEKLQEHTRSDNNSMFIIENEKLKVDIPKHYVLEAKSGSFIVSGDTVQYGRTLIRACDRCGKTENDRFIEVTNSCYGSGITPVFKVCQECLQLLCSECWSKLYDTSPTLIGFDDLGSQSESCAKCRMGVKNSSPVKD